LDDWQQSQAVNGILAKMLVETNAELNREKAKVNGLQQQLNTIPPD